MLNIENKKSLKTKMFNLQQPEQEKAASTRGNRFIFQGLEAEPMFHMESNIDLPMLNEGEVLVKVRVATICLSDIHTVCGTRKEPAPR